MIALPRPPPASRIEGEKGDEDMVIGPPPQAAQKQPDGSDKEFDEDSPEDSHRILLSNEIVLRGHTKVTNLKLKGRGTQHNLIALGDIAWPLPLSDLIGVEIHGQF